MAIHYGKLTKEGLSTQIAEAIRAAILEGRLLVEERLPSETELAERFGVSRPTVREALKRLAAQNLIRTQRGPAGGAFVNRLSLSEAQDTLVATSTLFIGMNGIPFEAAVEARQILESGCVDLAVQRHEPTHLEALRAEIALQRDAALSDEDFCASDVRFHRALVDAAGNPLLSFQMAGVIEGLQPLMNMITYRSRDRHRIADWHAHIVAGLEARDGTLVTRALADLSAYLLGLVSSRRPGK